jgi:hypothetical protein
VPDDDATAAKKRRQAVARCVYRVASGLGSGLCYSPRRAFTKNATEPRLYGEVRGVEGKGDRKRLGVCGWLTTGLVGAELLGTAVAALGIQFGAAPPHTIVVLTPVGAMED